MVTFSTPAGERRECGYSKKSSLIKIQQTQSEPSRTLKHALYFNIYRLSAMFMQFGELVFLSCILTSGMKKANVSVS